MGSSLTDETFTTGTWEHLSAVPSSGGTPTTLVSTSYAGVGSMATDGASVYFGANGPNLGWTVNAVPVQGGPVTTIWQGTPDPATLMNPPGTVTWVALSKNTVFWLSQGIVSEGSSSLGFVMKKGLSGGVPVTLA